MIKLGISWCKPGMMSQCTAPDQSAQEICDFYDNSLGSRRCMHRCEHLNNHCDCQKAQVFAVQYGVRTPDDIDIPDVEEELVLDLSELDSDGRRCDNCILYACSYVIHEQSQASSRGGLTMKDLSVIAKKCPDFDSEESMQQKINQSLRGNNP